VYDSPVGELLLGTIDGVAVCRLSFTTARPDPAARTDDDPVLVEAAIELDEYFAGRRSDFTVPLSLRGSEFERQVWAALLSIPYGETRSYGAIAKQVGEPDAARAVGVANNRNPVAIIVPCHRVIGADGKLVGYGAGLPIKRTLLGLEARVSIERDFRM
jgi:methylated-DNA-[protein]-cysteine S-methyltransferase